MNKSILLLLVFTLTVFSVMGKVTSVVKAKAFVCPMPKSIMLHSYFGSFLMEKLALQIISDGYVTMTYNDVYELWDHGKCPPSNAILISLDDLSGAWLRKTFRDMIKVFIDHGLVLTVGVVSYTPNDSEQNPEVWDYFKSLDAIGIEIASHSTHHYNLTQLSKKAIEVELNESYEVICKNLGKCPTTFILPFGNGWNNQVIRSSAIERYRSLVSIEGPDTFGGDILIMKRMPPPDNIIELKDFLEKYFPQVHKYEYNENISVIKKTNKKEK